MNEPCARITLDVQQASTATFVAVKRGDIGRKIVISLSDGGFPYEIAADCYAVLTGTKPDGNILYNHCDIEGNTIVYEITEQTTAAAGRIKAEVKLYSAEDALVTSATFRIIVDGTVYVDDQVESSSEFSALTQLVAQTLALLQNGSDDSTDSGIATLVVTELPTEDISATTIYLVPDGDDESDKYTEYMHVNGSWEIIGFRQVEATEEEEPDSLLVTLSAGASSIDLVADRTYDEIAAAYNSNKVVRMVYYGNEYSVTQIRSNTYHFYPVATRDLTFVAYVVSSTNVWSYEEITLDSGGNVDYTLPVATAETLGGVKPVAKTEAMIQPVGVDENGALYTEPSESGGSDYVLPVGGAELGGVKNGGNVTINEDGTMTAPEAEISGEQVSAAVSDWLDAHPEATTTVADGSINPDKTTWMRQVYHNILDVSTSDVGQGFYTSSAATTSSASCSVSAPIPVTAGTVYRVVNISNIRWLDSSKAYIGMQANNSSTDRFETAPNGAAYARMQYTTANAGSVQVHEYIGEEWEYDTYKNLYSIVMTDPGYAKAVADLVEGKFLDGSLTPAELFADESMRYKQMTGWDEYHWALADPSTFEKGGINSNGEEYEGFVNVYAYNARSGYIPVTPGETLYFMYAHVYGYDAEKNFVERLSESSGVGTVPEGVYFVRAYSFSHSEITNMNVYRRGYGKNDLAYISEYPYSHGFPVFKDEDSKEGFKAYLGIHPWADKNFGIIGDSFTAPGTWCNIMADNLKAANCWNKAVSGGAFSDYDGVPKTAYEQAQEFVADSRTLDVILITMGTNDANNSITIGDIVNSNSISDFDLTTYTGGMQACLNYLQNNFPGAIIYVGCTPMGGLVNGTKAEYITRMQEVCLMYGVEYIETRTCGVTWLSDVYAECYENGVNGGHPTGVGQQKIGAYMTRLMKSKL